MTLPVPASRVGWRTLLVVLTALAYATAPMRTARKHDEQGLVLLFDDRPDPDRDFALGRYKRHADSEAFFASVEARI